MQRRAVRSAHPRTIPPFNMHEARFARGSSPMQPRKTIDAGMHACELATIVRQKRTVRHSRTGGSGTFWLAAGATGKSCLSSSTPNKRSGASNSPSANRRFDSRRNPEGFPSFASLYYGEPGFCSETACRRIPQDNNISGRGRFIFFPIRPESQSKERWVDRL